MEASISKINQNEPKKSKDGRGGARTGAGRPRGSISAARKAELVAEATLKQMAAQYTPEAIRTLAEMFQDEATPAAARVAAIKEILDRAHGKPAQTIIGDEDRPVATVTRVELIAPQHDDSED